MKHNELTLGDWVRIGNGEPTKVTELAHDYVRVAGMFSDQAYGHVEPIEITPEILEKNGFTKEPFVSFEHYYCNYNESHIRAFKFYGEDDVYVDAIEPHMPSAPFISCARFKYVHELQHALRLCKIDKEIKL